MDVTQFSPFQRRVFLCYLAHELTICARSTYEAGTDQVVEPSVLRGYNELQHRVTASLREHLLGDTGFAVSVIVEMVRAFAVQFNRSEVQSGLERVYRLAEAAADKYE